MFVKGMETLNGDKTFSNLRGIRKLRGKTSKGSVTEWCDKEVDTAI